MRSSALCLALGIVLAAPSARADTDLSQLDLTGHWYLLVHYKDDRSQDKSITKFKDTVWSILQDNTKIKITSYPYVFFSEADELVRRHNMMNHIAWKPDDRIWGEIRESVRVSDRGAKVKTLKGSRADGFESNPSSGGFGMNTLTFSQNWKIAFAPEEIRIEIIDSLSGSGGLAGMDEAVVYRVTELVSETELRGRYDDATRHGELWMVRSNERKGQHGDEERE